MVVAAAPQAVEIDHRTHLVDLREGPVGEIPRTGHSLLTGAEAHEDDRAAEKAAVGRDHPGHFDQRRHTRGVAVGAGEDLHDRLAVDRQGMGSQVVETGADHDIFVAQLRIGALDDAHDIPGTDAVAGRRDGEVLAETVGEHQHTGVGERVVEIARRQAFAFAAGLAAVQFVVAERLDVPAKGRGNSKILCGEVRRTECQCQEYR